MSQPRSSIYRTALQVPSKRIAAMNDQELSTLMGQLLRAQAYRSGLPLSGIRVNTEGRAKDDGYDGWSDGSTEWDEWLDQSDTCWQFKAGKSGEPARLTGEVRKRIPQETLAGCGRFVVVASGSTNGKKGEDERLDVLTNEAVRANLVAERIQVFGSERIASWCNQHPSVAACWVGRSEGVWTLSDWQRSDEHQVPWQASEEVEAQLLTRQSDLDFVTGSVSHLHIWGPPGVGKTRFALDLCRGAAWRDSVLYI